MVRTAVTHSIVDPAPSFARSLRRFFNWCVDAAEPFGGQA